MEIESHGRDIAVVVPGVLASECFGLQELLRLVTLLNDLLASAAFVYERHHFLHKL